jgi:tetratricopeptide (TPR) repeat protein
MSDINRALALDPRNVVILNIRGQVFSARGDYARALADFDAALAIAPDNKFAQEQRRIALATQAEMERTRNSSRAQNSDVANCFNRPRHSLLNTRSTKRCCCSIGPWKWILSRRPRCNCASGRGCGKAKKPRPWMISASWSVRSQKTSSGSFCADQSWPDPSSSTLLWLISIEPLRLIRKIQVRLSVVGWCAVSRARTLKRWPNTLARLNSTRTTPALTWTVVFSTCSRGRLTRH